MVNIIIQKYERFNCWYDAKVEYYKHMRINGYKVAIPYGYILEEARKLTDEEALKDIKQI